METVIVSLSRRQTAVVYERWINEHFPADEVKPLKNIYKMWDKGCYSALGMYEAGAKRDEDVLKGLIGYAFFVNSPDSDVILLDYLAIISEFRSMGIGSDFLQEMRRMSGDNRGILIETEDVDLAESEEELVQRKRRDAFYISNGVVSTGIKSEVYGVPYAIWSYSMNDVELSHEDCLKALKSIYETMFPADKLGTVIKIYE